MDFPKLVSLLDKRGLFFTRANKLEDQFEGTWSRATLRLLEGDTVRDVIECDDHIALYSTTTKYGLVLKRPHSSITDPKEKELFDWLIRQGPSREIMRSNYGNDVIIHHIPTGHRFIVLDDREALYRQEGAVGRRLLGREETIAAWRDFVESWKELLPFTMVSCWHESDYESEAMWRRYAGDDYGIAIRTNMKSLAGCFIKRYPDAIARVEYIPYDQEIIPFGLAAPLLFKRNNFDQEREVRAIMTDFFEHPNSAGHLDSAHTECPSCVGDYGRFYDVDPNQLIHQIVIGPFAAPWLHELTQSVTKKYGVEIPVVQSSLNDQPSW